MLCLFGWLTMCCFTYDDLFQQQEPPLWWVCVKNLVHQYHIYYFPTKKSEKDFFPNHSNFEFFMKLEWEVQKTENKHSKIAFFVDCELFFIWWSVTAKQHQLWVIGMCQKSSSKNHIVYLFQKFLGLKKELYDKALKVCEQHESISFGEML